MSSSANSEVSEDRQSLWAVAVPPTIWTVHFLMSYIGAALWCGGGGRGGSPGQRAIGFGVLTAAALIGIGVAGWRGWLKYQHGGAVPSHHRDTPEDRRRFLGLATALLAGLSGTALIYVALAVIMLRGCA